MALIEISNLKPAGSDLFASAESFLTELQATDSSQIFGGGHKHGGGSKKSSKKSKKSNKSSNGGGHGCPPHPCFPCH